MAGKTYRLKLKSKRGTRRSKIHRKKSNTKRRHVRRSSCRGGTSSRRLNAIIENSKLADIKMKNELLEEKFENLKLQQAIEADEIKALKTVANNLTKQEKMRDLFQPLNNVKKSALPDIVKLPISRESITIPEYISMTSANKSNNWLNGSLELEKLTSRKRNTNSVRLPKL